MNFRSIAELSVDIRETLGVLPDDVALVVGIPRSGMLAASILALYLNVPLADFEGFISGRVFSGGATRKANKTGYPEVGTVLVVDDSSSTGAAMRQVAEKLKTIQPSGLIIKTLVVYGISKSMQNIDFVLNVLPLPRIFEWNVFHHPIIESSCLDIDGVVCLDPRSEENDDGHAYKKFLLTAPQMVKPSYKIGALVTSRLEKYRDETERWLNAKNITYEKLIMLDLPDAETRRRLGSHAVHKAAAYRASSAILFIESELSQALEISKLSGRPVLSIENMIMIQPKMNTGHAILWSSQRKIANNSFVRKILGPSIRATIKKFIGRI